MKRTIITSSLAAAALAIGATGAVAALDPGGDDCHSPLQRLVCEATDGVGIAQGPYYVAHDADVRPDVGGGDATVEADVSAGVYETATDRRVVGTDQSIDKTGAETGSLTPTVDVDPTGGGTVTTIPADIVCLGAVCAPPSPTPVGAPSGEVRVFGGDEEAITVHHATGATGADPGELCVRTQGGCDGDADAGGLASISDPNVSINE